MKGGSVLLRCLRGALASEAISGWTSPGACGARGAAGRGALGGLRNLSEKAGGDLAASGDAAAASASQPKQAPASVDEPKIPATSTTGNPELDDLLGLDLYKLGMKEYREETQKRAYGRAWEAKELRLKSFEDLHKLWYVLLKERNCLVSERHRFNSNGLIMPQKDRIARVRPSQKLCERLPKKVASFSWFRGGIQNAW